MSLAGVSDNLLSNIQSPEILKKYQLAIKRVANEHGADEQSTLTEEELIRMINAWEPQRDMICLYVRWARQLRRNFNLDSIATVLSLSRQCGYTPINFLRKVKTLYVNKNEKATMGISFHFEIPDRADIDRTRLNKEFLGLSVTLSLLQEQITTTGSVLGKTGMRQRKPRKIYAMAIPIDKTPTISTDKISTTQASSVDKTADGSIVTTTACSKQEITQDPIAKTAEGSIDTIVGHPTIEFHKHSSLLNRIWQSINHRWLALFIVEHLFRRTNNPWSYQDALIYSFQMMAPCGPCRFDFLSILVGYCLKFPTHELIALKQEKLQTIWLDPSSFTTYGNACLSQISPAEKVNIVCACFRELLTAIPKNFRRISYNRDHPLQRRWCMIRAYAFHFWLDSATNHNTKASVCEQMRTTGSKKKRKVESGMQRTSIYHQKTVTTNSMSVQERCVPLHVDDNAGFQSIISSRRTIQEPLPTIPTLHSDGISGNIVSVTPDTYLDKLDWTKMRLITQNELDQYVMSYLLIHRLDGVDVLAYLSPLEVYSADNLHDLLHSRLSGPSSYYPKDIVGQVVLHVRHGADSFVDRVSKSFHIARESSTLFQEHVSKLPCLETITMLCKAIVLHGKQDNKRSCGQYRVNLGNGGLNWHDGSPCKLHGMQFQKELEKETGTESLKVFGVIGKIAEFCWDVAASMQHEALDPPIAPDKYRKQLYASHLNEYLNMNPDLGFEDLTVVVSSLHPTIDNVAPHRDVMNDTMAGYTRTVVFNMVMIGDHQAPVTIVHFQLICNFRKVIGQYVRPFHKFLSPVTKHARQYLQKWQHSMHLVFAGKSEEVPSITNRFHFFLDDTLQYETITICRDNNQNQAIAADYLLTEVGMSRTLSLSMFINSIVKLQPYLKFDQSIEIAFACSYLSNPFWFDWTMSTLIQRLEDTNDTYVIGLHPFYDWCHNTIAIFGTWQGGPYNRWSPCGGRESIIEQFGAHPDASGSERREGEIILTKVVTLLYNHVEWINSWSNVGANNMIPDMSLSIIKTQCDQLIANISQICPCQFGHFRLGIMTSILSGCGLLKPGVHLRNLMYPVKGAASYKHLSSPDVDYMSSQRAMALGSNQANVSVANDGDGFIDEEQHDIFMQYLSTELGFQNYFRDQIECILCESHPMRSLNCRDWFRKGITIFDCNDKGEYFARKYGKDTTWVKLSPPGKYELAFVGVPTISYIPFDPLLACYSNNWGNELRSANTTTVRFKGRNTKTSAQQMVYVNNHFGNDTFHHPSMKMADFFVGHIAKKRRINSMYVLSDSDGVVTKEQCNDMDDYKCGKILWKHLLGLKIENGLSPERPMAAGCYHMDLELNNGEVTFFPGHVDKPFVDVVWFVPIGTSSFFTLLAVPRSWGIRQDLPSLNTFSQWKTALNSAELGRVDEFLNMFESQSKKGSEHRDPLTLIYFNKPGSVLAFPANHCYHATITPKKPLGYPRDLMVFHPLDGTI